MLQPSSLPTTLFDASLEIGVILLGTFILGMMMGWIIKPRNYSESDILEDMPEIKTSYAGDKKREKKALIIPQEDDLKIIVGITPKIEKLLNEKNIKSYEDIVREDVAGLEVILTQAGPSFQKYSPITWSDQARLAAHAKWSELEEYQEILSQSQK